MIVRNWATNIFKIQYNKKRNIEKRTRGPKKSGVKKRRGHEVGFSKRLDRASGG